MLTLPPIRHALDLAILECLQNGTEILPESLRAAMFQCVLSGLPLSCGHLSRKFNVSLKDGLETSREVLQKRGISIISRPSWPSHDAFREDF